MPALADVERLLERLFERTSARVFRTRLRPVQLERRIERAMELERVAGREKTLVPDRFRVRLHPTDLAAMGETDGLEPLAGRLAEASLAFARAHGFQLLARPTVALVADPSIEAGSVAIETGFGGAGPGERPRHVRDERAAATEDPGAGTASTPADAPIADPGAGVSVSAATPGTAAPRAAAPASIRDPSVSDRTMVYRRPVVAGPKAILRLVDRAGRERTVEVDGTLLTIGRARDNTLHVDDSRVSRYHGRLQARRGALVYTDLGSTNGTRVNGLAVDEIALGLGDRIELGDTVLVVESLPG